MIEVTGAREPRSSAGFRRVSAVLLVAALACCDRGSSAPDATASSPPRGPASPSAGTATPPPSAPAPPAASKPDVATLLGLADGATAEPIGKLLEAAAKSLAGEPIPDPDAVYEFLVQSIDEKGERVEFKRTPDEITRGAGQILDARERWGSEAEGLLRAAADRVQSAKWGYSSFTAKSEVLRALDTLHPSPATKRFRFHADPGLAQPLRPLTCPVAEPRFSVGKKPRYFEDKTFTSLVRLPDAQLPDGALREVVGLLSVPVVMNEFIQGGSGEVPPLADSVAVRFGDRAIGCLFEALADPIAASRAAGGTVESLRYNAAKVAAKLPTESSVKLFRAALLAGWTDWTRELPQTPEHQALIKELGDGPFLRAFENPYRLPVPSTSS